jgi:hypothetical protein
VKKQFDNFCLYAPRSCMLFVNRGNDDATTCAFSRGCWEVNGTAVEAVCGGLTFKHSEDKYNSLYLWRWNYNMACCFRFVKKPIFKIAQLFLGHARNLIACFKCFSIKCFCNRNRNVSCFLWILMEYLSC